MFKKPMKMRDLEVWGNSLLYCGYLGEELFSFFAAGSGRDGETLWGAEL